MKQAFLLLVITLAVATAIAQHRKTENLIIVTLDGLRWQEVFKGADPVLLNDSIFNRDREGIRQKFWAEAEEERRQKLFPFLWLVVARQGRRANI